MPRAPSSRTFSNAEITRLLDTVESVLPRGMNDWEDVAATYNQGLPERRRRETQSLCSKWTTLLGTRPTTGTNT